MLGNLIRYIACGMKKNNMATNILNFQLMKAVEKTDLETGENKAIQIISDPNLDRKDLSALLEDSLMGRFKDKETGEVVKLDNKTMMAGLLNLLNQIDREQTQKEKADV